ncbi:MAG TPA: class I SAM-dependent methyltransferase, partial [Candidatus Dojkabacteria bacterium]|nr:class I SAM-dependent methyltransferase [Candidatus Dojkabacteria bacterium]
RGGTLFLLSRVSPGDSLLISIDIELPKERQQAYQEFARERQRIYCIQGNSFLENTYTKVLRILKGKLIDLLFIDGDHSFFGVANDYVKFSPLVRPGGHIVFHDINKDSYLKTGEKSTTNVGKVPIFWEALKQTTNNFLEIINDPDQDGYGIGIIKKE